MWVLFRHFIIEYINRKMPRNYPLKEKGKFLPINWKEKIYQFHCKRTVKVSKHLWEIISRTLNQIAPEDIQVPYLKLQIQPDINFFEKLQKDNQAEEICKNVRIYPSLQEEFINFSMNCQILYIKNRKTAPALTD